ncbi:hypothetical protein ACJD0Z_03555 [Flavobacteriaceae bacterium M23B6Z8]
MNHGLHAICLGIKQVFSRVGSFPALLIYIHYIVSIVSKLRYKFHIDIEGLTTSYEKEIDFNQEMQGTAEIVVEELTVLQRIFYQLREIFDRAE